MWRKTRPGISPGITANRLAGIWQIETASENSFVFQLTGGLTWLGATDEVQESFWAWANGQPFDYQNFAEGEPDHQGASYVS